MKIAATIAILVGIACTAVSADECKDLTKSVKDAIVGCYGNGIADGTAGAGYIRVDYYQDYWDWGQFYEAELRWEHWDYHEESSSWGRVCDEEGNCNSEPLVYDYKKVAELNTDDCPNYATKQIIGHPHEDCKQCKPSDHYQWTKGFIYARNRANQDETFTLDGIPCSKGKIQTTIILWG